MKFSSLLCVVLSLMGLSASAQVTVQTTPGQPPLLTVGIPPNQRIALDVLSKIQNGIATKQIASEKPTGAAALRMVVQDTCVGNWRVFWPEAKEHYTPLLNVAWPMNSPTSNVNVERPLIQLQNGIEIGANVLLANDARTVGAVVPSRAIAITIGLKAPNGEIVRSETVRSSCKVQF